MRFCPAIGLAALFLAACQDVPSFDTTWKLSASISGPGRITNYEGDPPGHLVQLQDEDYDCEGINKDPVFLDGPLAFGLSVCNTGNGENILPVWKHAIANKDECPEGMEFHLFKIEKDGTRQEVPRQFSLIRFSPDPPLRYKPRLEVWTEIHLKPDPSAPEDPAETRCARVVGLELREIFKIRSFGKGKYVLEGKIGEDCPFLPPGTAKPKEFIIGDRPPRLR